jgi:hypothetical protein
MNAQSQDGSPARSYLDDYLLLSTVHRIFSTLQGVGQQLDDLHFEPASLAEDIRLNHAEQSDELENEITARLQLWQQVLEKFDAQLTVATLRHYFEQIGLPESASLELLITFYLAKNIKAEADRDKIDLIVTRWGRMAFQTRENETLLLPAPSLRAHLEEIAAKAGLELQSQEEIRPVIETLERERKQLLTVRSLRELVEKQVLLRLRRVKNDLGELFFHPTILSEVVALNISLHNVFQDLFLAEQARLTSFLQQQGDEQTVTAPDQALASMIERPNKTVTGSLPTIPMPVDAISDNISLSRSDLMETIQNMRSVISLLDQQLQALAEKIG